MPDACYAIGQRHLADIRIAAKNIISNFHYPIGDDYLGGTPALRIKNATDDDEAIRRQAIATSKRLAANCFNAIGDRDR